MDEGFRIKRVRELELRTVRRSEAFDTITCLVAQSLGCPTALVTIVDAETQWFLGKAGFDCSETPRTASFCSVCMSSQAPLLITDAQHDKRFADNPLVTDAPRIRSYLGVPLYTPDAVPIGALCAISPEPHAFSEGDLPMLQSFALLVEGAIAAHDYARELKRANDSLQEFNQLFHQAEVAANIGAWRIDLETNALRWSDQVYAIHGLPLGTPIDVSSAIAFYEPIDRPMVRKALAAAQRSGRAFRFEANIRRPDGEVRRIRALGERIGRKGQPQRISGIFRDCTDEYLKSQALEQAVEMDQLSGLRNRAGFHTRLGDAFQLNPDSILTVMLIDLDGFNDINERLGHGAGDELLAEISARFVHLVGEDSTVARWGGDEFAVLFPADTMLEEAVRLGCKLSQALEKDVLLGDVVAAVSATFGIAQVHSSETAGVLIRRADLALKFGKENGRGGVHCWNDEIEGLATTRQRAIANVTKAFADGHAYPAYQPVIEIETGTVIGVEALLRIQENAENSLTGSDVFAAIKEPAISREVLRFMLDQVLRDGPALLARYGPMCSIGINVSEADLRVSQGGDDFVSLITRMIGRSGLRPSNIVVEVTETMLLRDDTGKIRDGLHALDRLGYVIALDDFGTGYSSLTHLRDFPISKVKIDKEFIAAISSDHQSRLIVQAIVQMSRSLGLDVIAEGVEHASEEMFLRAIGCRYAQGYRYGRPARLNEQIVTPMPRKNHSRILGKDPALKPAATRSR